MKRFMKAFNVIITSPPTISHPTNFHMNPNPTETSQNHNGNVTQHCVRTLHAEQNAIIQAARFGIPLEGATLYCKMTPCRTCAMMIINAGIKRVVSEKRYHTDEDTKQMLKQARVELTVLNDKVEKYRRQ
jgi:dCMP deaminase